MRIARLVELWPELPERGDMADLVEHRGGNVNAIRAEVEALADAAEPVTLEAPDKPLAWRPFPVDALSEPLRSFVREAAKAIGCDPSFIALPLLAALAAAIGGARCVQLKSGWAEPAILWCAIIGESGTLKTPAFNWALQAIRAQGDPPDCRCEAAVGSILQRTQCGASRAIRRPGGGMVEAGRVRPTTGAGTA